jgi:hypothetical protein
VIASGCGTLFGVDFGNATPAGSDDAEAASSDALLEGAPFEAAPDAGFCQSSAHAFCADFDENDVLLGWGSTYESQGKTSLGLDTWVSPPASLDTRIMPAAVGNASYGAYLDVELGNVTVKNVHSEVDLRLGSCSPVNGVYSLVSFGGTDWSIQTAYEPEMGTLAFFYLFTGNLSAIPQYGNVIGPLSPNVWVHLSVNVFIEPKGSMHTVQVRALTDGGASFELDDNGPGFDAAGPLRVDLGLYGPPGMPSGNCEVHFDNYTIDYLTVSDQ